MDPPTPTPLTSHFPLDIVELLLWGVMQGLSFHALRSLWSRSRGFGDSWTCMSTRGRYDVLLGCTQIHRRVETNSCNKRQHMRVGRVWGKLSLKSLELLWVKAKDLPFIIIERALQRSDDGWSQVQEKRVNFRTRRGTLGPFYMLLLLSSYVFDNPEYKNFTLIFP